MRHSLLGRSIPAILVLAACASPLAAQVAPTLPRDTLFGRKLPPESSVPRGVVAPTLPRDTLGGRQLPPTANVPRGQTPTFPSDSLPAAAAERARWDSVRVITDSAVVKPAAPRPAAKRTLRHVPPRRQP